jgi:hypothetical protein
VVDGDDAIPLLEARRSRRRVRLDLRNLGARSARRRAGCIDDEEEDEGDEHVRQRTGGDHRDALPRRLPPVRVGRAALVDVAYTLLGGAARRGAQLRLLELRADGAERSAGGLEGVRVEVALHGVHGRAERRILADGCRHVRLEVAPRRPVHPRNAHVPAKRDRPDPVLDAVPFDLHDRRREADVESARLHSDKPCDREMAELVQQDEQREAEDDDEPGHGRNSPSGGCQATTSRGVGPSASKDCGSPRSAARFCACAVATS